MQGFICVFLTSRPYFVFDCIARLGRDFHFRIFSQWNVQSIDHMSVIYFKFGKRSSVFMSPWIFNKWQNVHCKKKPNKQTLHRHCLSYIYICIVSLAWSFAVYRFILLLILWHIIMRELVIVEAYLQIFKCVFIYLHDCYGKMSAR